MQEDESARRGGGRGNGYIPGVCLAVLRLWATAKLGERDTADNNKQTIADG